MTIQQVAEVMDLLRRITRENALNAELVVSADLLTRHEAELKSMRERAAQVAFGHAHLGAGGGTIAAAIRALKLREEKL